MKQEAPTPKEWQRIIDLAFNVVEAEKSSPADRDVEVELIKKELLSLLEKYPDSPDILGSLGDYEDDFLRKLNYYESSYAFSGSSGKCEEMASVATSAMRACVEEEKSCGDEIIKKWKGRLISLYDSIEDCWEKEEARILIRGL